MSDEEYQKRLKEAKEKFEYNFIEFKRKKFVEAPCVRSTFLTSKIIQIDLKSLLNIYMVKVFRLAWSSD